VLVVHRDATERAQLEHLLVDAGYDARAVASAPGAHDAIGHAPPAAVLVGADLEGPGDGVALVKDLRSRAETARCALILLTSAPARAALALGIEGLEAGADDYVVLPADPAELLARVSAHLRARRRPPGGAPDLTDRAAVVARMASITATAAGAVARSAASAAMALPGVVGAAVVVLDEPGRAHVAGVAGSPPRPFDVVGVDLGADAADRFWQRAGGTEGGGGGGPWAEPYDLSTEGNGNGNGQGGRAGWLAVAPVPAGSASASAFASTVTPLAVLALWLRAGAVAGDDPGDAVLAAAMDLAAALRPALLPALLGRDGHARQRLDLDRVIADPRQAFWPVFQPVFDVREVTPRLAGHEALTRFDDGTPPLRRFAAASRLGRRHELELATVALAIEAAADLQAVGWLSVNLSPGSIMASGTGLADALSGADRPIVVELSGHDDIDDVDALHAALDAIEPRPLLAVEDAGSGYDTLQHVMRLAPDFVKLDPLWVRGIDVDPARRALVVCLVDFAERTRAQLIAEGVERPSELETLRALGVGLAQGWLLGHPAVPS
jgi:EAL domain-containing protein (putative c-di-GMP-specific phosphodiesterase class I)/CheY-like chemotaxis protein